MFDEEADTTSFDPGIGFEVIRTQPADVTDFWPEGTTPDGHTTETMAVPDRITDRDIGCFDDTDALIIDTTRQAAALADTDDIELDDPDTDRVVVRSRAPTNGDWPPRPRPPTARTFRRAGMYKAITKV